MLGERSTTEIHRVEDSQGVKKLKEDAQIGGSIAGGARKNLEKKLGKSIVTKDNFLKEKDIINVQDSKTRAKKKKGK